MSFRISDVFLPEPQEVLAALTPELEANGVLVEFSDSGSSPQPDSKPKPAKFNAGAKAGSALKTNGLTTFCPRTASGHSRLPKAISAPRSNAHWVRVPRSDYRR